MATTEQRRQEAIQRREKLEARAPQLIEIVKKGQHFTLYTPTEAQDVYIWCEMGPARLYWERSTSSNGSTSPVAQPKVKDSANCLYLDSIADIIVSQPNDVFTKHNLVGNNLLCCLQLSIDQDGDQFNTPSAVKVEDGYVPQSLYLKAKDRLQLEVLVIALRKLLESAGFDLQDQVPASQQSQSQSQPPTTPSKQSQSHQQPHQQPPEFQPPPRNALLETLTPKQVVKLLIKNHESMVNIDLLPFLDILYSQGIPITRVYNDDTMSKPNPTPSSQTPLKIEETRLYFYPDVSKGVLYWGQYRKPTGMLKLYEISELLCGKTTNILKDAQLNQYDPSKSITITSLTPSTTPTDQEQYPDGKYTTLIIVNGDVYELNLLMFAVHRLVCHAESTDRMREKYRKNAQNQSTQQSITTAAVAVVQSSQQPVVEQTTALVKKNNNDSNDIIIKPPSLSQPIPETSQTTTNTSMCDIDDQPMINMPKVDFTDSMAWLLDQFTQMSFEETKQEQKKQQQKIESTVEIDAFISHITRKVKAQRSQVELDLLPEPNVNSINNSSNNSSITSIQNLTLNPHSNNTIISPSEQPLSPMKQRLNSYQSSSQTASQQLKDATKVRNEIETQTKHLEDELKKKQDEVLQLELELVEKRKKIQEEKERIQQQRIADQDRFKVEREEKRRLQQERFQQEDEEQNELNLSLFSPTSANNGANFPQTPSKANAELAELRQSLSKAKFALSSLNKRLMNGGKVSDGEIEDDELDFNLALLSFSLDNLPDGDDDKITTTNNSSQQDQAADGVKSPTGLSNRPRKKSLGSQLDLDETTRKSLAEFTPNPDALNTTVITTTASTNDIDTDMGLSDENTLIDITSLLVDNTKDKALQPSSTIEQQLQAIPSLPKSPMGGENPFALANGDGTRSVPRISRVNTATSPTATTSVKKPVVKSPTTTAAAAVTTTATKPTVLKAATTAAPTATRTVTKSVPTVTATTATKPTSTASAPTTAPVSRTTSTKTTTPSLSPAPSATTAPTTTRVTTAGTTARTTAAAPTSARMAPGTAVASTTTATRPSATGATTTTRPVGTATRTSSSTLPGAATTRTVSTRASTAAGTATPKK